MRFLTGAVAIAAFSLCVLAQESVHMHDPSSMNQRGAKAMGFSQTATTHHFRLLPDGGYVQVQANDAGDAANREHVRMHLRKQAKQFADGNFSAPELTHALIPPGVPQMQRLKASIRYTYQQIDRGARLRISSNDPSAIAAIHEFLRFQIADHHTGDSPKVKPK